jgi:Protein of unknown function (DUF2384)
MAVVLDDIRTSCSRVRSAEFARLLPSVEESHQPLLQLGIPEDRLPRDPSVDVVGLVCTLDRLFATGCGHAGVRWFLRTPDVDLNGQAPADVLDQPDGVDRIRELIAREIRLSRER